MPGNKGTRRGNGAGHGPGKGQGWGGPAKGAASSRFVKGEMHPMQGQDRAPPVAAAREERLALLRENLWNLAFTAERQETQLAATTAYLDREEGKPMQRQEVKFRTVNPDDLTDDELAAIATGRGLAAAGPEGDQD
jgi:hypothetical protein